ncbi:hypothetical protein GCM10010300_48640 [Streptomyces olivaceoviridis]|uniref:tautomerase family protein n=1 Tax=Streptomyces olivaceoviridis TaxID=1921 RepID=UPI001997A814|nr:tautomerase family protein [Streptomyces olivaceoviridis]GGY99003.1 hypothetical protein GCM10010300_48640 [Streptomyces olivaceoviridis]
MAHRALVDALDIPERDRFQIITEHDADRLVALDAGLGFEAGVEGLVMIHILTQSGRSDCGHRSEAGASGCSPRPARTRAPGTRCWGADRVPEEPRRRGR